jgi:hypothetical protein
MIEIQMFTCEGCISSSLSWLSSQVDQPPRWKADSEELQAGHTPLATGRLTFSIVGSWAGGPGLAHYVAASVKLGLSAITVGYFPTSPQTGEDRCTMG